MLVSLTIHNIVLIDLLTLEGRAGLSALTGETGAGKSILLDALGLALGGRTEAKLVRHGTDLASVTACFDLPAKHPVFKILKEKELETADTLILRRTLGKDGRSKAFVNDAPVSVQLLKEIGAQLVEIHGQFETQGLLDPQTHRHVLDSYAGITPAVAETTLAWQTWKAAREKLEQAMADIAATRLQEEYLQYTVAELEKLDPQSGEETLLAEKRSLLLNREKLREAFDLATDILESEQGVQSLLGKLRATLDRMADKAGGKMTAALETLNRAQSEVDELAYQVEHLKSGGTDGENLAEIEDRYFALRECAKKHRCTSDELPAIHEALAQKLRLITHQDEALAELTATVNMTRKTFITGAEKISAARQKAALKLGKAVNAELPALKLDKAKFTVESRRSNNEAEWGPEGFDKVQFVVSTNAQAAAGPIHKIASGGELARFMLALKLILAETSAIPTLIFDEVDSGIGGATADAVGERLARLSEKYQVLVVTHSPQVAARAAHHWIVAKTEQKGAALTKITPLKELKDRQEEIARMLSGAKVTAEARAAAGKLLENQATLNVLGSHQVQRGNALFLILIAVGLFAALSYAITQSGRGSGSASKETDMLAAAQIMQMMADVRTNFQRMSLTGTAPANILAHTGPTPYAPCTSGTTCLFAPEGGGAVIPSVPSSMLADPNDQMVNFMDMSFGLNTHAGAGVDAAASVIGLKESICAEINRRLGIVGIPVMLAGDLATSPTITLAGDPFPSEGCADVAEAYAHAPPYYGYGISLMEQ